MKRLFFILVCLFFVAGCVRYNWKTQEGKTNDDWVKDDDYCTQSSERAGAVWNVMDQGTVPNNYMRKDYERCMKEKGWLD